MLLYREKCEEVFRKVAFVKEHKDRYCIAGDHIPVSIKDLKWTVEDMYGLAIDMKTVVFDGQFVRGMVERYDDDTARILIRNDMSRPWQKFTAAKELAHLIIDEKEDWSPRGDETIAKMIRDFFPDENGDHRLGDGETQSEMLAEHAAREIMYPFTFRKKDLEELTSGQTTLSKLALHYELPDYVVAATLDADYMKFATAIWETVLKAK